MADDDDLKRAIKEHENRPPDSPWRATTSELSETRRARIRAACERRGEDAEKVLAECERRGYWEWFDCGDNDEDEDDEQPLLMPAREMPDFKTIPREELVEWLRDLHEMDQAVAKVRQGLGQLRKFYMKAGVPEPDTLVWYRVQLEADTVAAGMEPPSMVSQCVLAAFDGGLGSDQINGALVDAGVVKQASATALEKNFDQRIRETKSRNAAMKRASKIPAMSVISTIRRMVP